MPTFTTFLMNTSRLEFKRSYHRASITEFKLISFTSNFDHWSYKEQRNGYIIIAILLMMSSPSEWSSFCGLQGRGSIPHPSVTSTINSATNHIRARCKWMWVAYNSGDDRSSILHHHCHYQTKSTRLGVTGENQELKYQRGKVKRRLKDICVSCTEHNSSISPCLKC